LVKRGVRSVASTLRPLEVMIRRPLDLSGSSSKSLSELWSSLSGGDLLGGDLLNKFDNADWPGDLDDGPFSGDTGSDTSRIMSCRTLSTSRSEDVS